MVDYEFSGPVELFDKPGGWYYVRAPEDLTDITEDLADRGLVAVTATVGATSWDTSLLPMGDGSHFVALNAKVREAEAIGLGDRVTISVSLRDP